MACGYFGKLPARADFVSRHCPAGFLQLWEPFLINGLAQSRQDLTDTWEEVYMTMPIWRFWLTTGETKGKFSGTIVGAIMPSVDRVGREFPLSVFALLESREDCFLPSNDWFAHVEAVLLNTLKDGASLPEFQKEVADLDPPWSVEQVKEKRESIHLEAMPGTEGGVRSGFECSAGTRRYQFECAGLPHPEEFRWLLLPEADSRSKGAPKTVVEDHGRYKSEDHRT